MELTQEYFDKGLSGLLEKMTGLESRMGTLESNMVTKAELKSALESQTKELKNYTHESFETQQGWMDERFKELVVAYDVRGRVGKLEKDVAHLKLDRTAHV